MVQRTKRAQPGSRSLAAITDHETPEVKELEEPGQRFHFRTSPAALDVPQRPATENWLVLL